MDTIYKKQYLCYKFYLCIIKNYMEKMLPENDLKVGTGKVLVIDDDPVLVQLVEEMLDIMGYKSVSSISSKEGLQRFKDAPKDFDLIITDMTMPEMNGDMLAREIISIRKNIPIILCTGFNEQINEEEAKKIGICEFILKPVNMKTLSETIQRAICKF